MAERVASSADIRSLGTVGDVEVATAITSEPWYLPVESLVLSVGSTLGTLATGARGAFPEADWGSLATEPLRTGMVRVMRVPDTSSSSPGTLRFFIVAAVGDGAGGGTAPLEAVTRAEMQALGAAMDLGVSSLAMPLLGAGAYGLDLHVAAGLAVTVVREQLQGRTDRGLRRVLFVGKNDGMRQAVELAWQSLEAEDGSRGSSGASTNVPRSTEAADSPGGTSGSPPASMLSSSAMEVLGHATAVSADRTTPGVVDGQLVLLSALFRRRGETGGVAGKLGRLLAGGPSGLPDLLRRLAREVFVPIESLDKEPSARLDFGPVALIVDRAREFARRTASDEVHVRHLLAAVVTDALPENVKAALDTTSEDLRNHVREAIHATVPDESPAEWDEILLPQAEPFDLAGGYSRDTVDDAERIPLAEDRLGVGTYVSMLATVIARRDTPLPLSVGLFGEWGSGKSYFMGLLRDRIHTLSQSGDEAYWREIVPITFNAWHYADTNLWASLGNEIFEQLAGPGATAAENREALRDELTEKTERAMDLRAASDRAEQEAARLQAELDVARTAAAGSKASLIGAVAASPTVKGLLDKAWARLGVSDEVEKAGLLAAELRQTGAEADALRLAAQRPRGWVPLLLAAVALGGLASSAFFAGDVSRWLAGGGVTGLVAAAAALSVAVRKVRSGLRTLTAAAGEIRTEVDRSTDEKVAEERTRLREAEARASVLSSQLSEVLQRVGELGRQLAELDPGRRWYGFVTERAASDDYRRELGLISTIRRDFERLIDLLKDWQHREAPDERHRPIDRIVLYIDDLDRCSSKQVVDVLQAVHLLLALDLFVVVVGVDPRWLLHSLREQYRTAFRAGDEGSEEGSDTGGDDAVWRSTPHDYLEKIFNIPFVLPGMTTKSFGELIRKLDLGEQTHDDADQSSSDTGQTDDADGRPSESADEPAGGSIPSSRAGEPTDRHAAAFSGTDQADEISAQRRSEAKTGGTRTGPVPRRLTDDELELVASLGPLVRSPRQAKRLLNLYRMVRSTRDLSPASDFLGSKEQAGEYQAVGVLLGLLTSHPRLLGRILAAEPTKTLPGGINHRQGAQTWRDVVDKLEPRSTPGDLWENDVCAQMSAADCVEWTELVERVRPATELVSLPDLTAFQFWGPRLSRFSFVLSPLAVTTEEPLRRDTLAS